MKQTPPYMVAVGVSGGLDSTCAYLEAVRRYGPKAVGAVYINFGQPYAKKELEALDALGLPFTYIPIPLVEMLGLELSVDNEIIPGRNGVIASVLAPLAREVWIAGTKDDMHGHTSDKSPKAFQYMSISLTEMLARQVVVTSPFDTMSKVAMLSALENADPKMFNDTVRHTVSCYHPTHRRCGDCHPCTQRWLNLWAIGHNTAGEFAVDPMGSEATKALFARYAGAVLKGDYTHYHRWRINLHWTTYLQAVHHREHHPSQFLMPDVVTVLMEFSKKQPTVYDIKAAKEFVPQPEPTPPF